MVEYKHYILAGIAIILTLVIVLIVIKIYQLQQQFKQRLESEELSAKFEAFVRENNMNFYYSMELWLKARGAGRVLKELENPAVFALVSLISGLIGYLFFGDIIFSAGGLGNVVVVVLAMLLPTLFLVIKDKSENEEMIADLDRLYNSIRTQVDSNIYATVAVYNSIELIRSSRLRDGLQDFSRNVVHSSNAKLACKDFIEKFNNPYITSLANIIIQMTLESGASRELLEDIEIQLEALQKAKLEHVKESYKNKLNIILFLILGITLAVLLKEIVSIFLDTINQLF